MSTQTLELNDPAMTVRIERMTPPKTVFEPEPEKFRENFDRASFQFGHHLSGHPLFELPALLELSKSLPFSDIYYDSGEVSVGQRWDAVPRTQLSVDQLIDRIENAGAWILLKKTNRDPRYAAILDQALAEAARLVGPAFPTKMKMRSAVVLVTSPNRISSYHIDPDCNFLCQIQGEKVLHVFDRYDRENLPEEELERFWATDKNAAIYKEKFQNRAASYEMRPGVGVHMPLNAPHWVKNSNNISVTLALIFQYPESHIGHVYRYNHYLRKLGLRPKPPGHSRLGDSAKSLVMASAGRPQRSPKSHGQEAIVANKKSPVPKHMSNSISLSMPAQAKSNSPVQAKGTRKGTLVRLRQSQIRLSSALVGELSRVGNVSSLIRKVRRWPVIRPATNLVAGYNRVFPDLATARQIADKYAECSHESPENAQALFSFMEATRPSDYPAILHLSSALHDGLRVFDLGGTMGNLFYLYNRYLNFGPNVRWTVHDLPANMQRGKGIASQRAEDRIQFADDPAQVSGHDLLLVSGSLHYFEFALPEFLSRLEKPPRHVLINRTPLVDAPEAATVQSIHGVTVACKLLNRRDLIAGMQGQGYELKDSWTAPEFSIRLPYDPDYWVKAYSGLYFRARD